MCGILFIPHDDTKRHELLSPNYKEEMEGQKDL